MEIRRLDGTRTSQNWGELPGNFDKLNLHAMYPSGNEWGIPDLPVATFVPDKLVAYNDRYGTSIPSRSAAVHFFLDDYRFETMWTKPLRGLSRVLRVGAGLTPDFSLWRDMPLVLQLYQVYRSRWVGNWMLQHGCPVVPTISWSTPDSYRFAFAGIPQHSVVAISAVGIRGDEAVHLFTLGCNAMIEALEPSMILVYGRNLFTSSTVPMKFYPTRWDERKG